MSSLGVSKDGSFGDFWVALVIKHPKCHQLIKDSPLGSIDSGVARLTQEKARRMPDDGDFSLVCKHLQPSPKCFCSDQFLRWSSPYTHVIQSK